MNKQLELVKQFHKAFGIYTSNTISKPSMDVAILTTKLLREELDEVNDELISGSARLEDVAKEPADLQYILLGTVLFYGLQDKFETIFEEVHRSNMTKLDENGNPVRRNDGKVIKSKLYEEANIKEIIGDYR
jgi:predicted HAD superfamily Cof-like phosphohydrolase